MGAVVLPAHRVWLAGAAIVMEQGLANWGLVRPDWGPPATLLFEGANPALTAWMGAVEMALAPLVSPANSSKTSPQRASGIRRRKSGDLINVGKIEFMGCEGNWDRVRK
ncbi:hypothetical protein GCM10028803_00720 [Larkinella knui]